MTKSLHEQDAHSVLIRAYSLSQSLCYNLIWANKSLENKYQEITKMKGEEHFDVRIGLKPKLTNTQYFLF